MFNAIIIVTYKPYKHTSIYNCVSKGAIAGGSMVTTVLEGIKRLNHQVKCFPKFVNTDISTGGCSSVCNLRTLITLRTTHPMTLRQIQNDWHFSNTTARTSNVTETFWRKSRSNTNKLNLFSQNSKIHFSFCFKKCLFVNLTSGTLTESWVSPHLSVCFLLGGRLLGSQRCPIHLCTNETADGLSMQMAFCSSPVWNQE